MFTKQISEVREKPYTSSLIIYPDSSSGNLSPAMGAMNKVGIGLSYRPASLCSLAIQSKTQFLESIPCLIAGLKIPIQKPAGERGGAGPSNASPALNFTAVFGT